MTYVQPPSLVDRAYISRYAIEVVGLETFISGVPADPDGQAVTATFYREDNSNPPIDPPTPSLTTISAQAATWVSTGTFTATLHSSDTQTPGYYIIKWDFLVSSHAEETVTFFEVGPAAPVYDSLGQDMKTIVDNVWIRFADLFDSPEGGPNLQTYYQTNWSRGRMAQLMIQAINRLNTIGQPKVAYTAYPPSEFPIASFGGLLELALYCECVKHLIRSYTEQPDPAGIPITRMDRRAYVAGWRDILAMEQVDLKSAEDVWRIQNMNLGRARVLVSGGAYGRFSPNRLPVSAAARPRFWSRFY